MTMFGDLKVGDKVFVAWQRTRYDRENGNPQRASTETVTKVGRKYGYFGEGPWERKFRLDNGQSHHDNDCNARSNGYGFDVFLRGEDFVKQEAAKTERKLLKSRIFDRWGGIKPIPLDTVVKMNRLLDEIGWDKEETT